MEIRNKKKVFQPLSIHFFVVALAIAIGFYVAFADSGKYIASVDILIIPKNDKIASHIDKVRENIIFVFEKNNKFLDDVVLRINEDNTLISIESRRYDRDEAVEVSEEISKEIITIASKYYSVKNDLNLRIIEGELQKNKRNVSIIIILSIVLGALASFVIQIFVNFVENFISDFTKKKKDVAEVSRDIEDMLSKNRSKIEDLSYKPKNREEDAFVLNSEEETEPEVTVEEIESGFKKAASPQNLPIESFDNLEYNAPEIDDAIPSDLPFEVINENVQTPSVSEISEEQAGEPTEEEYRERLNQLIRGE